MAARHLDGTGQGEYVYDFKYDILTFKIKNRNYKQSLEFHNFVVDIDDKNFITGIRIFDASRVFQIDKYALKNIVNFEFQSRVENNIVTITFKFGFVVRNMLFFSSSKDIQQQLTERSPIDIADSTVGPVAA